MRITKPRVSGPVWAAIFLGLIGGFVIAYLTYHLHVNTPDKTLDVMHLDGMH
jgi:hypothetical protein